MKVVLVENFENSFRFHAVRRFKFYEIDLSLEKEVLPDENFEESFRFHAVRRFKFYETDLSLEKEVYQMKILKRVSAFML